MKKYLLLILLLSFMACNTNGTPSENDVPELKKAIIEKGDEYSHMLLDVYYSENNVPFEIIPYTLIMINKHKKHNLYSNLFMDYLCVQKNYGSINRFDKFDSIHKKYLINILNEGAKKEDLGCVSFLDSIYRMGYYGDKNLKKADSLKTIINKKLKIR